MSAYFPPARPGLPCRNLLPGELFCAHQPHALQTLLGSCVSLCLWDCRQRFGGMNHFLLPTCPANEPPSFRYGDVAVPALVQRMLALGSRLETLRAKLFGGAAVLAGGNPALAVGQRNVEVALGQLQRLRIPLAASRLAGAKGLVLRFCTDCGTVWVRTVDSPGLAAPMAAPAGASVVALRPDQPLLPEDGAATMTDCPAIIRTRPQATDHASCQRCLESAGAVRCAS